MSRDEVLVVDDEPGVLRFVARALQAEGITVDTAPSGDEGYQKATRHDYAVVVLDLVMPGMDGTMLLRRLLRRNRDQSVIVLSCLSDTRSKVRCLDMGAQDYLSKPFALNELLARIRVRLRDHAGGDYRLSSRDLVLDPVREEVTVDGRSVPLTRREAMLLAELIQEAGSSVSKQRLLSSVWGYDFDPETNVVDVYVGRLRKKLGAGTIATVRGAGYGIDI